MTASAPSGDWARRAGRVGRCVARFRLASKPRVQAWQMNRVTSAGARCVGCDDEFQPGELHVEVVVARTVLMELHDECFDVWTRFAQGGRGPTAPDPVSADEEDDA
jgi:hypothetical protein